ncbi:uncharacterized protein LOC115634521 [Scaptodrosophila lebanonensis]|uniref:Uncharacterized protein LOC115634521 n=1 Tax=Drosophila lebanonensis TaxID=7225 RepID=A0A6J2ULS6_DROLE|nr:uncharacterized protein LOC115634521 [Scaptodrosophila lebanonensis]
MHLVKSPCLLACALVYLLPLAACIEHITEQQLELHKYRVSPKLTGPVKFVHDPKDVMLNELDSALQKISTVYIQALFSGTHTPEVEGRMRSLEIELFDLLDQLYKQNRLADYMKYEAEVTRQMIIYNMLKKLFGYAPEELDEKVE